MQKKKMVKKTYKQKYEDLKSEQEINHKIEKHTKNYIHIPFSWGAIGRFFAFLLSVFLSVVNFMLIISTWKMLDLRSLSVEQTYNFSQLLILYPLIGEYILIGLSFICLIAIIKGGFNNLKGLDKDGLIFSLIFSLIVGLIFSLIVSLIVGLIVGLIFSLIVSLIVGLICEFEDI